MKHHHALVVAILVFTASAAAFASTLKSHDEKSFPAISGGKVRVMASFQDIQVRVRPGGSVRAVVDMEVTASGDTATRLLEEYKPTFESRDREILIREGRSDHGIHLNWHPTHLTGTIRIEAPPGMIFSLETASGDCLLDGGMGDGEARLQTASGDVKITGSMKILDVDTASGDVQAAFDKLVGTIRINTASGDVALSGPVGKLTVETASGDIKADDLTGEALFDTSSGDITALWSAIPAGTRVKADTASGGVHLTFPAAAIVSGRAKTSSGDITCDFPGIFSRKNDRIEFQGGEGAIHLDLDTSSGDISILKAH